MAEACGTIIQNLSSGVRLSGYQFHLLLTDHVILLELLNLSIPLFLHLCNSTHCVCYKNSIKQQS